MLGEGSLQESSHLVGFRDSGLEHGCLTQMRHYFEEVLPLDCLVDIRFNARQYLEQFGNAGLVESVGEAGEEENLVESVERSQSGESGQQFINLGANSQRVGGEGWLRVLAVEALIIR